MKVDGVFTDMPGDYPKFEVQGDKKNFFLFRIPKFNNTILIDPTVTTGAEPPTNPPETTASPTASASTLTVKFFALLLSVAAMLKL